MPDGDAQITRRGVMALLGAMSGAGAAAAGLSNDNGQGNLSGGTMALSEPYNVAGNLWIGPDSAKSEVDAKSGRVYIGASGDGYTIYNGDNGSWDSKGLGDSANPLPSVNTDDGRIKRALHYDYSDYNPHPTRGPEHSTPLDYRMHPAADNPVLTAADVTDVTADFVADPFVVNHKGKFHMFLEVDPSSGSANIGHATSPDGFSWSYDQIVITASDETLSWPYTFKYDGSWYMALDRGGKSGFHILEANSFPRDWTQVANPRSGDNDITDPAIIRWNGDWYAFGRDTSVSPSEIRLFYNTGGLLSGSWTEHSASPVHTSNDELQQGGGRPIVRENYIDIPWQENDQTRVRWFRINDLSTSSYSDSELPTSPTLEPSNAGDWRDAGHHHVDAVMPGVDGRGFAIVDGNDTAGSNSWSIGVAQQTDLRPFAFRAHLSADQNVPDSDFTIIQFDSSDKNEGGNYDTSNGRFTAPRSGRYYFETNLRVASPDADQRVTTQIRNTTQGESIEDTERYPGSANPHTFKASGEADLQAGDKVLVRVYQTNGSAVGKSIESYSGASWFAGRQIAGR